MSLSEYQDRCKNVKVQKFNKNKENTQNNPNSFLNYFGLDNNILKKIVRNMRSKAKLGELRLVTNQYCTQKENMTLICFFKLGLRIENKITYSK